MVASDRPPSFLFDVAAFLSDTNVAAMTAAEVGAYLLLLCYAWQSRTPGTLPLDDALLARLSRLGAEWPAHRAAVLRAWDVRGEVIVQKRMVLEAAATERRIARAREAGRVGGTMSAAARMAPVSSNDAASSSQGSVDRSLEQPSTSNSNNSSTREPTPPGSSGGSSRTARPRNDAALSSTAPKPLELAWIWVQANVNAERRAEVMRFAGWLLRTGTRDPAWILALVKHRTVHHPDNEFAYYTPKGTARQSIEATVASDAQIARHEAIKEEERKMFPRAVRDVE